MNLQKLVELKVVPNTNNWDLILEKAAAFKFPSLFDISNNLLADPSFIKAFNNSDISTRSTLLLKVEVFLWLHKENPVKVLMVGFSGIMPTIIKMLSPNYNATNVDKTKALKIINILLDTSVYTNQYCTQHQFDIAHLFKMRANLINLGIADALLKLPKFAHRAILSLCKEQAAIETFVNGGLLAQVYLQIQSNKPQVVKDCLDILLSIIHYGRPQHREAIMHTEVIKLMIPNALHNTDVQEILYALTTMTPVSETFTHIFMNNALHWSSNGNRFDRSVEVPILKLAEFNLLADDDRATRQLSLSTMDFLIDRIVNHRSTKISSDLYTLANVLRSVYCRNYISNRPQIITTLEKTILGTANRVSTTLHWALKALYYIEFGIVSLQDRTELVNILSKLVDFRQPNETSEVTSLAASILVLSKMTDSLSSKLLLYNYEAKYPRNLKTI